MNAPAQPSVAVVLRVLENESDQEALLINKEFLKQYNLHHGKIPPQEFEAYCFEPAGFEQPAPSEQETQRREAYRSALNETQDDLQRYIVFQPLHTAYSLFKSVTGDRTTACVDSEERIALWQRFCPEHQKYKIMWLKAWESVLRVQSVFLSTGDAETKDSSPKVQEFLTRLWFLSVDVVGEFFVEAMKRGEDQEECFEETCRQLDLVYDDETLNSYGVESEDFPFRSNVDREETLANDRMLSAGGDN